ncbi:hypothetical protein Scep_025385 [Stephania cephalantha]|uniref:Uncharacterized protein n=1 Tax=Stephania cephalantha TaxID=152367 RepID=A0AAP0HRI3_9MAGN
MADQRDTDDQSGATGPCPIDPADFQTLTQRVASQDRRLDEILTLLRGQLPSPSTPIVASTQDMSAPTPQATPSRSTVHATPFTVVVPTLPDIAVSSVAYMGRFHQLLPFADEVADTDRNLVHFFCDGLFPAIRGIIVTTELNILDRAYERSLTREVYLVTHPDDDNVGPVKAQSRHISESDRKRKWNNHFVSNDFKTQSVVAPPAHLARTIVHLLQH